MTPWVRAARAAGPAPVLFPVLLLSLVLFSPSVSSPAGGPVPAAFAYDVRAADASPSASASVSAGPSRAGSRAGEGRLRPGRPLRPESTPPPGTAPARVPDAPWAPATVPSAPQAAVQDAEPPADRVMRIIPLGGGLILIGLGLALALLGLRLRRDQV